MRSRDWLLGGFILLALLVLFLPALGWAVRQWRFDPYYGHGPLIVATAGVLLWMDRKKLAAIAPERHPGDGLLAPAGLAVALAASLLHNAWGQLVGLLFVAAGLVLYLGGRKLLAAAAFPLAFLLFAVPFPYVELLTNPLQQASAAGAASVMGWLGEPLARDELAIEYAGSTFLIAPLCSGLSGLTAMVPLAVLLSAWLPLTAWPRLLLPLLAVPVSLAANVARIVATLLMAKRYGPETAVGFFHGASSLLLFVAGLAALIGLYAAAQRIPGVRRRAAPAS